VRRQLLVALLVSALAAAVLGSDRTASAGGSNWVLDREHYLPGDPVFGWASIAWAHNPSLGTPDDGPYYAWLAPVPSMGFTGDLPIPEGAVRVAEILVSLEPYGDGPIRFGPHHAEVRFVVPDLPPGRYTILHSNAAGTKTLGDVTGQTSFWIDAPGVGTAGATPGTPRFAG
jgi:hypothetical protein